MEKRTKRAQRDGSVDRLLSAAKALFVSKGYRATTLEQIASAAHLTKGAVYFHFGAKESVLLKLLERVVVDVLNPAVQVLESPEGPVTEKLIQFMRIHGEMGLTRREDLLLLISMSIEFAGQNGEAADRIKAMYQMLYRPLEALIRRGQAAGEIRRDAPSAELAAIVVAMHDGAFLEWYRRGEQLDGRNLVRASLSVLLHGL